MRSKAPSSRGRGPEQPTPGAPRSAGRNGSTPVWLRSPDCGGSRSPRRTRCRGRVVVPDAGVLQPPDLPGDAEACGQDAAEEVGTVEAVGGETALEEELDGVLARRLLHRVVPVRVVGRHVRRRIEDREGAARAALEVPELVAQAEHHFAGGELAVAGGIAADGADAPLLRRRIGAVGGRSAVGRRLIGVRGGRASLPFACHRVSERSWHEDNDAPGDASSPGSGSQSTPRGIWSGGCCNPRPG